MKILKLPPLLASLALVSAPSLAQDIPLADAEDELLISRAGSEILVVATRIRGQVETDVPPVMTLNEADIASYGASSIGDLVTALSTQTGSGRGRGGGQPVMLLNGQRISSFREMRGLPPEAIRKVEVLPEEVALRFGFSPDQRVMNFILKDNFSSRTAAAEFGMPTRGGFARTELEAGMLRIDGLKRLNIEASLNDETMLTERERKLVQPASTIPTVAADRDPADYRSLIDDSRDIALNATWTTGFGKEGMGGSLALNGKATRADSRSLSGLSTVLLTAPGGATALRSVGDPLERHTRATTFEAGVTLNKPLGTWLLAVTADAAHSDTRTAVDSAASSSALVAAAAAGTLPITGTLPLLGAGTVDRARTRDLGVKALATLIGRPLHLPAGDAALTIKAGLDHDSSRNSDSRGSGGVTALKRDDLSAGFNMALPVASRRSGVLSGIGDLSLNFGAGVNELSDFGTLTNWTAGLNWSPFEKLSLSASYIVRDAAPSLNQLGNPQLLAFNVPTYDFSRGETAFVTLISGGNPALVREKQRDVKLSANWELPVLKNSNLIAEYFRNRSNDVTQSFPLLTPEIEAAFPGRAVRDASGRLVSIDRRPVTFDAVAAERVRWGLNISGPIGKPNPQPAAAAGGPPAMRAGPGGGMGRPGAGRPGGGGGGPMGRFMGGGGNGQGRWNMSVFHTYRLSEDVTIAPGGPVLDLLGGDALINGGVSRHEVQVEGGLFHKGLGTRLNGTWRNPVRVDSSGAPGTSDLRFGSTFVLNARLFVNFAMQPKLLKKMPFLKGANLSFEVDNLFDSRQKVTDESGAIPLSYQRGYRDPRGRVIGLDFRKMF